MSAVALSADPLGRPGTPTPTTPATTPTIPIAPPLLIPLTPPASAAPTAETASDTAPPSEPSQEFLDLVPHEYARRHLILSAGCEEGIELLLAAAGTRATAVFNVGVRLGRAVRTRSAAPEDLAAAIDRAYARARSAGLASTDPDALASVVEGSTDVQADLDAAVREAERDVLSTQGKAPAVRLVDLILFDALRRGASDVHVQPLRDRTLVRCRLDGALHTVRELPASLAASVTSRVKIMARLDVAEHRAPQDGRATVTVGGSGGTGAESGAGGMRGYGLGGVGGRRVDLRVSTLPSTYGERVVVRLLDPSRSPHLLSFAALGMPPMVERAYLAQASRTSGIVLSTGPTGSGKTTTLYTTLAWISATHSGPREPGQVGGQGRGCELNMMTIEDPVEYDLSGASLSVSQTQVDPKKNVTFVTGLRHILRQDPDVIMVGEVRDEETARIAVQASLTGHLVLSTLHTADAAGAVARLLDLGVEPFLVASSLSAVLAQRLVRTLHPPCAGQGCGACLGTGFKGRTGVFELLVLTPELRALVGRRASAIELKEAAQRGGEGGGKDGMVMLARAGAALVAAGTTTAQEVARVIEAVEEVEP